MAKRLLSDGLLTSPSLKICSPAAQDSFHRFVLLADDFGCFEADPVLLAGRGWPYRREVTDSHVRAWIVEYAMAGMVLIWDHAGRWFAFLTGWWRVQRHRQEYSEANPKGSKRRTPPPPKTQGDIVRFSTGSSPSSAPLVSVFPGGKTPQGSLRFDGGIPAAGSGNPDFPDTQFQFQSQFQSQFQNNLAASPLDLSPSVNAPVEEPVQQRRRGRGKGEPDPWHSELRSRYETLFLSANGSAALWGPKEAGITKRVLDRARSAGHNLDEILQRLERGFLNPPPVIARGGAFTIGTFAAFYDSLAGTGVAARTNKAGERIMTPREMFEFAQRERAREQQQEPAVRGKLIPEVGS